MTQRYEFVEGTSKKFWEIELSGKTYTARWGRIGANGRNEKTQTLADAAAAQKAHDKLIAEKTNKGYQLVGGGSKGKAKGGVAKPTQPAAPAKAAKAAKLIPNPKLEAVIAENPADVGSWQVYADWLIESGAPWAEVIAHACRGKKPKRQQDEVAAAILDGLDGSLIKWKYGTIEELELCPEEHDGANDDDGSSMARALARALAHPAGRLVRKLTLGLPPDEDIDWSYDSMLKVIAKAGVLPLLHTVDLSRAAEHMDQVSWRHIGNLRPLWKAAPRLKVLLLVGSGRPCTLGEVVAPHLETLIFESSGLDKSAVLDLGKASLPALRHLELMFGCEDYGNNGTVKGLAGILAGKGLPKLEYLGLANSEWEANLIAAVAGSAILPRLKVLDLTKGILHNDGAAALLTHAAKFRHLEELDLDDNFLSSEHEKAIKKAIPCASFGSQREVDEDGDEGHRYASIGE